MSTTQGDDDDERDEGNRTDGDRDQELPASLPTAATAYTPSTRSLLGHHSMIAYSLNRPVWVRRRCRISPPRFLAECCKRQLNQGSYVLLYFRLFTFSGLY